MLNAHLPLKVFDYPYTMPLELTIPFVVVCAIRVKFGTIDLQNTPFSVEANEKIRLFGMAVFRHTQAGRAIRKKHYIPAIQRLCDGHLCFGAKPEMVPGLNRHTWLLSLKLTALVAGNLTFLLGNFS